MVLKQLAGKTGSSSLFYLLLAGFFIFLFFFAYGVHGISDSGDGVQHYIISRYSFAHPELLLDRWGKPVFTLISSPFSQFGLSGIVAFNILCGLVSSFGCYKIALKLNMPNAWTLPFFICFAPIYFGVMNSGLTEPAFSAFLVICIWLVLEKKYAAAAILASFLPYVRPEASFVLPFFILFFLVRRKLLVIPLLLTGTIIYSIIGYFYVDDIFWIINHDPYNAQNSTAYGSVHGELLHYIKKYDVHLGLPLTILFIAGCIAIIIRLAKEWKLVRTRKNDSEHLSEEYILVYGCLFGVIAAHSIVWWKGIFPTLGLDRYMSVIIPLAGIVCLQGLNLLLLPLKNYNLAARAILILVLACVTYAPFTSYFYPFKLSGEQALLKEAADWLETTPHIEEKIYYLHPFLVSVLDADPYDKNKVGDCWGIDRVKPEQFIPQGSIILWDGHFGPNECNLPVATLMNSPHYKLLKVFRPKHAFSVLGGHPFEVYAFQKR